MAKHIGIETPFYMAKEIVHMEPANCLVISKNALDRLEDTTEIIFHISFKDFNVYENRKITVRQIKNLLLTNKAVERLNTRIGMSINIDRNDCQIV